MRYVKLSPTKAAAWVDCPRRFFYSYVERRRVKSSWAHFTYGNVVHRALKEWFDLEPDQRSTELIERSVFASWSDDGFRDIEHSRAWRDRAVVVVTDYLAQVDSGVEPLATERTLAFKDDASGFVMEGRIDRLDNDGTAVMVVDYKTASRCRPRTTSEVPKRWLCTRSWCRKFWAAPAVRSRFIMCRREASFPGSTRHSR